MNFLKGLIAMYEEWKAKRKAKELLKRLHYDSSYEKLELYAKQQGWKLRFYNYTDLPGDILLQKMGLVKYASQVHSFCYFSEKQKIIFLKDYASKEIARRLLLHEFGHIHLNHLLTLHNFVEQDLDEDHLAESFSYYIFHYERWRKWCKTAAIKIILAFTILIAYFVLLGTVRNDETNSNSIRTGQEAPIPCCDVI